MVISVTKGGKQLSKHNCFLPSDILANTGRTQISGGQQAGKMTTMAGSGNILMTDPIRGCPT
jgi:hypothetical protein